MRWVPECGSSSSKIECELNVPIDEVQSDKIPHTVSFMSIVQNEAIVTAGFHYNRYIKPRKSWRPKAWQA